MSINVVVLVGNAGRDPELRFFESGTCVCEFSLAVSRAPRDGQNQDPIWVNCKAWGKTAQVAGDYLRKGGKVAIVGRLEIEQWSDRSSGEVRSKTLVVIDRLELCSSRSVGEGTVASGTAVDSHDHHGGSVPKIAATAPSADRKTASTGGWGNDWSTTPAGATPLSDEEVPF